MNPESILMLSDAVECRWSRTEELMGTQACMCVSVGVCAGEADTYSFNSRSVGAITHQYMR